MSEEVLKYILVKKSELTDTPKLTDTLELDYEYEGTERRLFLPIFCKTNNILIAVKYKNNIYNISNIPTINRFKFYYYYTLKNNY